MLTLAAIALHDSIAPTSVIRAAIAPGAPLALGACYRGVGIDRQRLRFVRWKMREYKGQALSGLDGKIRDRGESLTMYFDRRA